MPHVWLLDILFAGDDYNFINLKLIIFPVFILYGISCRFRKDGRIIIIIRYFQNLHMNADVSYPWLANWRRTQ